MSIPRLKIDQTVISVFAVSAHFLQYSEIVWRSCCSAAWFCTAPYPKDKIVRIQQFAAPELTRIDADVKERTREGGALQETLLEGVSHTCYLPQPCA